MNRTQILIIVVIVVTFVIIYFIKRKSINTWIKQRYEDSKTAYYLNKLHPKIRKRAKEFLKKADDEGIKLNITSSFRTLAEQTKLYNQGRTTGGNIVTGAKAGQSFHNYGLAFDVVPSEGYNSNKWNKIGALGESFGFEWGGRWSKPDKPHFQDRFGYSWSALLSEVKNGNLKGDYVKV